MEYLEAFINENLRLHPPVVNQVRTCTKDCEVKCYTASKYVIFYGSFHGLLDDFHGP